MLVSYTGRRRGSALCCLYWPGSGWCAPTERPSLGPSHPSEEQIRSRVNGPARHENRQRQQQTEERAFSFFFKLSDRADGVLG